MYEGKMLVSYVRDEKRTPVGCIVAIPDEILGFKIGYSLKAPSDQCDKKLAQRIAIGRAEVFHPLVVEDDLLDMVEKYYEKAAFESERKNTLKNREKKVRDLCALFYVMKRRAEKYYRVTEKQLVHHRSIF